MSVQIDITGILDLSITTNGINNGSTQCTPSQGTDLNTSQIQNCTTVNCTTVDCTTVDCTTINCTTVNCTTINCTTVECSQCIHDYYDEDCKD